MTAIAPTVQEFYGKPQPCIHCGRVNQDVRDAARVGLFRSPDMGPVCPEHYAPGCPAMLAITLYQPWATWVADGQKRYETRSWSTPYRGQIAIHAGKSREFTGKATAYPLGAVVAVAMLEGVIPTETAVRYGRRREITEDELRRGDWTPGRYAWRLTNVTKLTSPVAAKGQRKLWTPDAELRARIVSEMPS